MCLITENIETRNCNSRAFGLIGILVMTVLVGIVPVGAAAGLEITDKTIEVVINGRDIPYTDHGGVPNDWYGRTMMIIVDQDRWIMALRSGVNHIQTHGGDTIHLVTSTDEGRTWSALNRWFDGTVITGLPYYDGNAHSEPGLYKMPNGDLILQFWNSYTYSGTKQMRSTDNGKTWRTDIDRVTVTGVPRHADNEVLGTENYFVDPEHSTDVYMGFEYVEDVENNGFCGSILAKSQDNGHSYQFVNWLAPTTIPNFEPAIEYVGDRTIVAVLRDANKKCTWQSKSTDMGLTFSAPVDISAQINGGVSGGLWQRARLYKESNPDFQYDNQLDYAVGEGVLWGFGIHSNDGKHTRKPAVWWSLDNGVTWCGPELLHGPMSPGTDTGYGDMRRRADGTFVANTYYGDKASSYADLEQYTFRVVPCCGSASLDSGNDGEQNAIVQAEEEKLSPKAPFRVLFSNDCTNITTCKSPYHARGQAWTPEMLEASVDETAGHGIDVHLLQPAMTWVPWWPSKVYPMEEHYLWWKEHFGVDIPKRGIQEYILQGGDPVQTFIDRCNQKGLKPFVSLRLNDAHFLEFIDTPENREGWYCLSKFYAEHPEYRIGSDLDSWKQHVQNWAISEVRDYKFKLIEEICENYEITGLELDFMRHYSYFQLDKTTPEQRKEIMTNFVRDVRQLLDRTSRDGRRRWFCVRIPCYLSMHDCLGIDVKAFAEAGVDMFNLSASYFTVHNSDITQIVEMVPERAVYLEMCHIVQEGEKFATKGYDNFLIRRTTPNQYYTAAHLAYSRGATGVSAFNFAYHREHGAKERGPFCEPPFHIFQNMGDPDWIARQPQHYVLTKTWLSSYRPNGIMPLLFHDSKKGQGQAQTKKFQMDLAPTKGGWKIDGKLRIQAEKTLGDSVWGAKANGIELETASDVSEPYENPYISSFGDATIHLAWVVPRDILKDGLNDFEITVIHGPKTTIRFIDLAIQ